MPAEIEPKPNVSNDEFETVQIGGVRMLVGLAAVTIGVCAVIFAGKPLEVFTEDEVAVASTALAGVATFLGGLAILNPRSDH